MIVRFSFAFACLALAALAACGGAEVVEESTERVTTLAQARRDYVTGLNQLKEGDYLNSMEAFQRVARGPSYIVYSPLARLRLADALFFQEKYEEAAEAYRSFMETSSGDPNLHYAAYMLAQSRVKAMPAEFLLVPPADRRDQRRVRAAMSTLNDFVQRFPDSPFIDDGFALLQKMIATVVSFEMEVAHFYMTREKPVGAVNRLKRLLADVPRASASEPTRAALVEALAAAGDADALRKECDGYRERFPTGKNRDKVTGWCAAAVVQ
jgi:outer membrane protein assembly factor BamD